MHHHIAVQSDFPSLPQVFVGWNPLRRKGKGRQFGHFCVFFGSISGRLVL